MYWELCVRWCHTVLLDNPVFSAIPTAYLVLSLLDTHHREGHGEKRYLPTKFKCTDENKARKVSIQMTQV